jgi:hypothetical protein
MAGCVDPDDTVKVTNEPMTSRHSFKQLSQLLLMAPHSVSMIETIAGSGSAVLVDKDFISRNSINSPLVTASWEFEA